MKFRILSLLLCLLMIISMFVSCGKEKKKDDDLVLVTSRSVETIGMYVITENETTAEAAQAVEDAINKIIKSKYTTKVDITFLTEDEYYETLEASFVKMKENASSNPDVEKETADSESEGITTNEEEIILNEHGVAELKYPDIPSYQADIFMITDYSKYLEYVGDGQLYPLNEALKDTYKKINDYVYPSFINAATVGGVVYAIPNNTIIGDSCEYMILDKKLVKEFGLDVSKIEGIVDLDPFFTWVKENKAGVTPILASDYDTSALYMSVDSAAGKFVDKFSLVGAMQKIGSTTVSVENLFANKAYIDELLTLAKFRFGGYFGNGANFAAAFKTGNAYDMVEYANDYEVVALKGSYEPKEKLCDSMFAISKRTGNFDRSMEVLTYLNTNKEIRNLLQYGIVDVNYTVDEEADDLASVTRLNNTYMMNLEYTGNVYMAHTEEGVDANLWTFAKKQNLVSVPCVFAGFEIPKLNEGETVDYTAAKALAKASAELKAALGACNTYVAYEALVNSAAEKYADVVNAFLAESEVENTPYKLFIDSVK